jgi:ATP-dependent 26S proteasome regulatory subunit
VLTIAILEILLREEQLADDVNLAQLAKDTQGFSGSDLKSESGMDFSCLTLQISVSVPPSPQ